MTKFSHLSIFTLLFVLSGCFASKPANSELDVLAHDVLKSKEGIDIQITPVDKPKTIRLK